jgi:hypothetical protein
MLYVAGKNDFDCLQEPLQRARDAGLKTAIHCGEISI